MECVLLVSNITEKLRTISFGTIIDFTKENTTIWNSSELVQACFPTQFVVSVDELNVSQSEKYFQSNVSNSADMDSVWVLFAAVLVFLMQAGFTMLEAGSVKSPNVQHILFKNVCFNIYIKYLYIIIIYI